MKLNNVKDLDGFFKMIDKCKGRVELVTTEGDRINLKSKLSQYVAFSNLMSDVNIPEMEILVSNSDDVSLLVSYMING